MIAVRDTVAEAAARKRARRREREDEAYLDWVRALPCLVCRRQGDFVQPHHEPPRSNASAWHDHRTVPLCHDHHTGQQGVHPTGRKTFERRWNVNLAAEALRLRVEWVEEFGG